MFKRPAPSLKLLLSILSALPLAAGFYAFTWGTVCFFGGPEGRMWDSRGMNLWIIFWLIAILCAAAFITMNFNRRWAWLVLLVAYELPLGFYIFTLALLLVINFWSGTFTPPDAGSLCGLALMSLLTISIAASIIRLARRRNCRHNPDERGDSDRSPLT